MRHAPRHSRPPEPRSSRSRVLTALLLLAALVGALAVSARAFPLRRQGDDALTPGAAWLGAWVQPSGSSGKAAQQRAVLDLERSIGRRLAIDHTYVPFGSQLGWRPAWDVAGAHPLITIGNGASTAEVAQGRHDVYLRQLAEGVRELGKPVFLRYAHRMDDPANSSWVGSPASYRAAWAHVRGSSPACRRRSSGHRPPPPSPATPPTASTPATSRSTGSPPTATTAPAAVPRAAGASCRTSSATSTCGAAPTASR